MQQKSFSTASPDNNKKIHVFSKKPTNQTCLFYKKKIFSLSFGFLLLFLLLKFFKIPPKEAPGRVSEKL